jgi:uncharacterized hydrophobic protein (TIGR00271 family)
MNMNNIGNRFHDLQNRRLPAHEIEEIRKGLLEESTTDNIYLVLIIGSCIIATLGLLSNSAAVIIGAMIVAPLMLPIRGVAFAALEGNILLFRKGCTAIIIGTIIATALAWFVGVLVGLPEFGTEIISRSRPNLLDLGIAVAAGGISGYAKMQPRISGSLAGTAIAVALMPPICVIGLGLSQANWSLSLGATLLYLTNLLGITLSCMLAFLLSGCTSFKRARQALGWTLALTAILVIPLGISFFQLVRQSRLEASLKQALLNRTITFQRVVLLGSNVNWLSNPPEVRLSVRTKQPITPIQVRLLEEFLAKEMSQPFTLIFEVGEVEEVRRDSLNNSKLEKR